MSTILGLQVALLILCFYCSSNVNGASCNSLKDCVRCVSMKSWVRSKNCRWCPLTNSCHTYMSMYNVCPASFDKAANCYVVPKGKYLRDNAYINVLLSAVAYSDHPQECLNKLLPDGGFKLVAAIGRKCSGSLINYKECFAAVAISDHLKRIVVANRGTTSTSQLIHQMLNALIVPKKSFKTGGEVQQYFNDAFYKLYPCVSKCVKDLRNSHPDYDLAVTGHSLGGAIASLTAVSLVYDKIVPKDKMVLYTYGQPRVGDKTYAMSFDKIVKSSWRVVHSNDIVARIPTQTNLNLNKQPYHHKTEVYYPAVNMPPDAPYKVCARDEDPTCVSSNFFNPFNILTYIKHHQYYFNTQVGQVCSSIGPKRKRSDDGEEISAMADMFTEDNCRVIHF
ncbi:hypothetical protein ACF0H5_008701 [Mactra antiquata]